MAHWTGQIGGDVNARGIWMRSGEVDAMPTIWPASDATETQSLVMPRRVNDRSLSRGVDRDDDLTERNKLRIHTTHLDNENRGRATQPPAPRRSSMRPRPSAVFDEGTLQTVALESRPPLFDFDEDDTITLEVDTGWHTHLTAGARPMHVVQPEGRPDPRSTQVSGVHVELSPTEPHAFAQTEPNTFEPVPLLTQGLQHGLDLPHPSDDIDLSGLLTINPVVPVTLAPPTTAPPRSAVHPMLVRIFWFGLGLGLFGSTAGAASLLGSMLLYGALFIF